MAPRLRIPPELLTATRSYATTSRRIPIPPPFPVTRSCPEPTCPCAEMPKGLEIDHAQNLNGTMAGYAQQVLISTGQSDWRSRIEEDGVDERWGMLGRGLKGMVGRGGKFSDPYNNILITNSSFPTSQASSSSNSKRASALLFPSFKYLPNIPLDEESLSRFVQAYLLPRTPHPAHDILPKEERDAMKRVQALESTFPDAADIRHSPTILICGHGHRDKRCGIMGPLLRAEFRRVLRGKGFSVAGDEGNGDGAVVDKVGHANVGVISHIGGHKYAGNVIVYLPPEHRFSGEEPGTLAGKGIWYGRIEPRHVEGIVQETILHGRVISDHFRGGIAPDGKILRL
ncbi:hypothetical protein AJ80_07396 [Polytolypa hystricis UAMH7299]|uniref:Altered inheritance of mitochondria protein 32 n=1 Tax=Polytolypa hystricis (strain UAMH7299) TaxID=1447883 RepID=A0A2B7XNK9_POLH7|nr:hypothetical protein AJ80_07396 [Polytolypa hystricis UAMH7299]